MGQPVSGTGGKNAFVILINGGQPPNALVTRDGLILKVLERNQAPKLLGYILTGGPFINLIILYGYAYKSLEIASQNNFDMYETIRN